MSLYTNLDSPVTNYTEDFLTSIQTNNQDVFFTLLQNHKTELDVDERMFTAATELDDPFPLHTLIQTFPGQASSYLLQLVETNAAIQPIELMIQYGTRIVNNVIVLSIVQQRHLLLKLLYNTSFGSILQTIQSYFESNNMNSLSIIAVYNVNIMYDVQRGPSAMYILDYILTLAIQHHQVELASRLLLNHIAITTVHESLIDTLDETNEMYMLIKSCLQVEQLTTSVANAIEMENEEIATSITNRLLEFFNNDTLDILHLVVLFTTCIRLNKLQTNLDNKTLTWFINHNILPSSLFPTLDNSDLLGKMLPMVVFYSSQYDPLKTIPDIFMTLLVFGANIHVNNDHVLSVASQLGHTSIVDVLIQNGANVHSNIEEPTRNAIVYNRLEIVKLLLDAGVDANAENGTFIVISVSNGYYDILKLLLEHGANANIRNNIAMQILTSETSNFTLQANKQRIVQLLREYGARLLYRSTSKRSDISPVEGSIPGRVPSAEIGWYSSTTESESNV